jgi:hypothetical protein
MRKIVNSKKVILKRVFVLIIIFLIFKLLVSFNSQDSFCNDQTIFGECSLKKPYFCEEGKLVEKASFCSCPELLIKKGDSCISKYQSNPKNITLKYFLRNQGKEIDFVVYEGMVNYLSNISKFIYHDDKEKPSRVDFKLKNINEKEQRELLLPLVVKIQNIAKDKKEQVKIATSIIQNISFGESNNVVNIGSSEIISQRYPYEVLYDLSGICGEKSELLAFLLKELDFEVVIFYFPELNHEAVGIKCSFFKSFNKTGYCYIETTINSEINNYDFLKELGNFKNFEMIEISKGESF